MSPWASFDGTLVATKAKPKGNKLKKNPAFDTKVKVNSIFVQECKKKKKKKSIYGL